VTSRKKWVGRRGSRGSLRLLALPLANQRADEHDHEIQGTDSQESVQDAASSPVVHVCGKIQSGLLE